MLFALLRLFVSFITAGFASSWNEIGILLGKLNPVCLFPQVMVVLLVLLLDTQESTLLQCWCC